MMLLDEGMVDAAEMFARAMRMNNVCSAACVWVLGKSNFHFWGEGSIQPL